MAVRDMSVQARRPSYGILSLYPDEGLHDQVGCRQGLRRGSIHERLRSAQAPPRLPPPLTPRPRRREMTVQPSKELEQVAQEAHAAWERGDDEWFKAHLSAHDPIMLGSDPEEQMIGAGAVTESTTEELANRDQYAFKATAPRIIDARESGDIGWTLTESRWEFEDGSYVPVRGLSVLHREDGVWQLIAGVAAPAIYNELIRPGSP